MRRASQEKVDRMERMEAIVHGVVQGVFFRRNTRLRAERLALVGTVANRPDGTVHIVAEGPRDLLEDLAAWLQVGPETAIVDRVDLSWTSATGSYRSFRVLR